MRREIARLSKVYPISAILSGQAQSKWRMYGRLSFLIESIVSGSSKLNERSQSLPLVGSGRDASPQGVSRDVAAVVGSSSLVGEPSGLAYGYLDMSRVKNELVENQDGGFECSPSSSAAVELEGWQDYCPSGSEEYPEDHAQDQDVQLDADPEAPANAVLPISDVREYYHKDRVQDQPDEPDSSVVSAVRVSASVTRKRPLPSYSEDKLALKRLAVKVFFLNLLRSFRFFSCR